MAGPTPIPDAASFFSSGQGSYAAPGVDPTATFVDTSKTSAVDPATFFSQGATPAAPPKPQVPLDDHPVLTDLPDGHKGDYRSARALQLAFDLARKSNLNIVVNSAYRSFADQQHLFQTMPPGMAAPPGHSMHEKGMAYDLSGDVDGFAKIAEQFGFARPYNDPNAKDRPYEPWHFSFQPGVPAGSHDRVWADDDPRMVKFTKKDNFSGKVPQLVQNLAAQGGFSTNDQAIILRQIKQESDFDPNAKSPVGAMGLGQMMPGTLASYLASKHLSADDYLKNPQVQTSVYLEHMGNLLKRYNGNWAQALAAYNGGHGAVAFAETKGAFPASGSPDSWYQQTLPYVAHILGVDKQTAMQWIAKGGGPSAQQQSEAEVIAQNRQKVQDQASFWLKALSPGSVFSLIPGVADTTAQGLVQKSQDTNTSIPRVMGNDILEGGKALGRGFLSGMADLAAYSKTQADKSAAGAGGLMLPGMPLLPGVLAATGDVVPWGKLAHALQPSDWNKPESEYGSQMRDGKDFSTWALGVGKWAIPGGDPGINPFDTRSAEGNLASLGMELPSLAGMTMSAELLGPEAGLLSKAEAAPVAGLLGAPGKVPEFALGGMIKRLFPNWAKSLGDDFFTKTAVWASVGGMQMASQATGEALTQGASPQQAVAQGLTAGMMGYMMGFGMGLGLPTLTGVTDATASKGGQALSPVLDAAMQQFRKMPAWRTQVENSMVDWVAKLDDATEGRFSGSVLQRISENVQRSRQASQENARVQTAKEFERMQGVMQDTAGQYSSLVKQRLDNVDNLSGQLQQLEGSIKKFETENPPIAAAAQRINELQDELQGWHTANGRLLGATTPEAQAKWLADSGAPLGVKDASDFRSQYNKRTKTILGEIQQLSSENGLDPGTVVTYRQALEQKNVVQDALTKAQADPVVQNSTEYLTSADVFQHMANRLGNYKEDVLSGAASFRPPREIDNVDLGMLGDVGKPEHLNDLRQIIDHFDESLQDVIDAGMSWLPPRDRLEFEVSKTTRALLESKVGNTDAHMTNLLDSLRAQKAELESAAPTIKGAPRPGSYDYAKNRAVWEAKVRPQQEAAIQAHQAQVAALDKQIAHIEQLHQTVTAGGSQSLSNPNLPRENVLAGKASEFSAEQQKLLESAGIKSPETLDNLYEEKSVIPGEKMTRQFRTQNEYRVKPYKGQDTAMAKAARKSYREGRDAVLEDAAKHNGYVKAEVPLDWVQQTSVGAKKVGTIDNMGGKFRPVILGGEDGGAFKIHDGGARVEWARQNGRDTIPAYVPKDAFEAMRDSKVPQEIKDAALMKPTPGGETPTVGKPSDELRNDALFRAKQWLKGLDPEDRAGLIGDQIREITEQFLNLQTPSRARYQQLYQNGAQPADWVNSLTGDLQAALGQFSAFRSAFEDYLHGSSPTSLQDMWARSYNAAANWFHMQSTGREVSNMLSRDFDKKFTEAVSTGKVPFKVSRTGELPQHFQERVVDAMQSMLTEPTQMEALLKDYPGLRDAFGAYFGMVQALEHFKIIDPELKAMFNDVGFFHKFPNMGAMVKAAGYSSQSRVPTTRLASETMRQYPTLAEARQAYTDARNEVTQGLGWGQISRAPATPETREARFVNGTPAERAKILGLDPEAPESLDKTQRILLKLGLKDPITNPAEVLRQQLSAVTGVDATRNFLRQLANIPVPGMLSINEATGRPYMVLERFKSGEAPEVPGLQFGNTREVSAKDQKVLPHTGQYSSKMVSLASDEFGLHPHSTMQFAGQEVPVSELYIHQDIARMLQQRFLTGGDPDAKLFANIGEMLRMGTLIGTPIPHAYNILTNHWMSFAGMAAQTITDSLASRDASGVVQGAKDLLTAPLAGLKLGVAGKKIGSDVLLYTDAALHGANLRTWNTAVRGAVDQTVQFLEKEMVAFSANASEELRGFTKFTDAAVQKTDTAAEFRQNFAQWDGIAGSALRHYKAGEGVAGAALGSLQEAINHGINADYWMNKYMVFEPIKQAQMAGYHYWSAVWWKDMGQKLMDQGLPQYQALELVKREAADYINKMSGSIQHYQDVVGVRDAMYGKTPVIGQIFSALSPGWLRSKVHTLLSVTDPLLDKAIQKGYLSPGVSDLSHITNSDLKAYVQGQYQKLFAYGIASSWAALQLGSLAIAGNFTFNMHPTEPKKWFGIQAPGGSFYSWPFFGFIKDVVKALKGGPADFEQIERTFADQLMPLGSALLGDLPRNETPNGQMIFSPDRSGDPVAKAGQVWDGLKYAIAKNLNVGETLGVDNYPRPFAGTKEMPAYISSLLGFQPQRSDDAIATKGYMRKLEDYYKEQMESVVGPELRRYAQQGDRDALHDAVQTAMVKGIPVHGDAKGVYPGGIYRMSDNDFYDLIAKYKQPTGYVMQSVQDNPLEEKFVWDRIQETKRAQQSLLPFIFSWMWHKNQHAKGNQQQ